MEVLIILSKMECLEFEITKTRAVILSNFTVIPSKRTISCSLRRANKYSKYKLNNIDGEAEMFPLMKELCYC